MWPDVSVYEIYAHLVSFSKFKYNMLSVLNNVSDPLQQLFRVWL